jgi:hypothetical protein
VIGWGAPRWPLAGPTPGREGDAVSTDLAGQDRYVALVREAAGMRGAIRAAADAGDVAEVERLLQRVRDLELSMFALRYTQVRHRRASDPRARWGHNRELDATESELSGMLAMIGQPHHTRGA